MTLTRPPVVPVGASVPVGAGPALIDARSPRSTVHAAPTGLGPSVAWNGTVGVVWPAVTVIVCSVLGSTSKTPKGASPPAPSPQSRHVPSWEEPSSPRASSPPLLPPSAPVKTLPPEDEPHAPPTAAVRRDATSRARGRPECAMAMESYGVAVIEQCSYAWFQEGKPGFRGGR